MLPDGWQRFTGFGVEFAYPPTTPQGQVAQKDEQAGRVVHIQSADRQELYIEFARFPDLTPEGEYGGHKPYLERRFGAGSVSELTETTLAERPAWTYSFAWHEEGRPMERAALLLQLGGDTLRIIRDPRSALNDQVLATLRLLDRAAPPAR